MTILKNPHFDARPCIYCQSMMDDGHESGFFLCRNHDILIGFYYHQDDELVYRMFLKKDDEYIHQMMFDLKGNEFNLIKMPVVRTGEQIMNTRSMIKLDHIPDIRPEQFDEYLEKLLSMRVFA